MGEEDTRRQRPNVVRMHMLGAEVIPVKSGSATLKDALNEAIRDWIATVETTHYLIGSAAGPHPYPFLVRELQRVIGDEARAQVRERTGRLPDAVVACVGGGSNAIGIFHPFRDDDGCGSSASRPAATARTCTRRSRGPRPRLDPARLALVRAGGRARPGHGVALDLRRARLPRHRAGAGVPQGRGPRGVRGRDRRRRRCEAFHRLCRLEGIIPALESSHALARAERVARELGPDGVVLVGLSGRGDKDVDTVQAIAGEESR